ncbi:MAG: histidine kinase dimerization/phospho-acceptor domain-containing protein, partial [Myxococcota bacterium]
MRIRLRLQLLLNVGLLLFFSAIFLGVMALYVEQIRARRARQRHLHAMVKMMYVLWEVEVGGSLAHSMRSGRAQYDPDALLKGLSLRWLHRWFEMAPNFVPQGMMLYSASGQILWRRGEGFSSRSRRWIRTFRARAKRSHSSRAKGVRGASSSLGRRIHARGNRWEHLDVLVHQGRLIGGIEVHWPLLVAWREMFSSQLLLLFSFLLFASVMLLLLLLFLGRRLIRPLQRLGRAMESLAIRGQSRGLEAELVRRDEIGDLALSFTMMEEKIQRDAEHREQQLLALQRTHESLKRAQEALIQKEKMSSVGHMAAGVAHEVGNPLSAILGYAELLRTAQEWTDFERDLVSRMSKEAQRIDRILREILDYARPVRSTELAVCQPQEVLQEATDLVRYQQKFRSMTIHRLLPEGLPQVGIAASHLLQVLINLMTNAADACAEKGTIRLSAEHAPEECVVMI